MQTSHLPHSACHSKNSVLNLFIVSTNIRDKIYKLNAGGSLFKFADFFAKHSPEYPKVIVLVTRGLMEFCQFVGQLRLNLLMDLMRGVVETKLMYRHKMFH